MSSAGKLGKASVAMMMIMRLVVRLTALKLKRHTSCLTGDFPRNSSTV